MTAGRKLEPGLGAVIEPIYRRDPVRYRKLILWVWRQQKIGWSDEAIAEAAKLADLHLDGAPNWWAYLTKLLPKAAGRASEQRSDQYKSELGEIADEFLKWAKERKGKGNEKTEN